MKIIFLFAPLFFLIIGCSEKNSTTDLDLFIQTVKSQSSGEIEPIPKHEAFEIFTYRASSLRSPFEPPKLTLEKKKFDASIKPDRNRVKHYLEQFDIASFSMVGYINTDEGRWGLVRNKNNIFRVKMGDYLGRNHGRISLIDDEEIQLLEIMPVGSEMWIERVRRIPLTSAEERK